MFIFSAIDIDVKNKKVYWIDIKLKTINRIFLNGSMPEKIITFGLITPEGNDFLLFNVSIYIYRFCLNRSSKIKIIIN